MMMRWVWPAASSCSSRISEDILPFEEINKIRNAFVNMVFSGEIQGMLHGDVSDGDSLIQEMMFLYRRI